MSRAMKVVGLALSPMLRVIVVAVAAMVAARDARGAEGPASRPVRPNIVFLFTDDQRHDALGVSEHSLARTPNLDRLAARGMRFENSFVTLSICSPSRAAVMTGQYGSVNGVTTLGTRVRDASPHLPKLLREAGYRTGMFGKWHLGNKPEDLGFDEAAYFMSNGSFYERKAMIDGREQVMPGYIDEAMAERAGAFITRAKEERRPFFVWFCTQLPHMDHTFDWPAQQQYLDLYKVAEMPVPATWEDDLAGKPPYLKTARSRTQALSYGYDSAEKIRRHVKRYAAATTQADAALGRVIDAVAKMELSGETWFVLMGDNGWMIGEHGMTSKVLAYEKSIRVPMLIAGPGMKAMVEKRMVLNIDLPPTILEIAGVRAPADMHGRSLMPLARGEAGAWRDGFVYEAPTPALGVQALMAARTERWKLIRTYASKTMKDVVFEELYDLKNDPMEMRNLAGDPAHAKTAEALRERIESHRRSVEGR